MKVYLIGANGRLGQAIAREYAGADLVHLDRRTYATWSGLRAADDVSRFFDPLPGEEATVFVASGRLDPSAPPEELRAINYQLPKNLIDGAAKLGVKIVTFGTVMERLRQTKNPYIQSKAALGEYAGAAGDRGAPALHLQLHTLFGLGEPSPFMFLGQILTAVRASAPFEMTSGRQLREYHHLTDEAKAIRAIATSAKSGVMALSHGNPVALRAVAEGVFSALGKPDLLRIGALPEPPEEVYEKALPRTGIIQQVAFRDPLPAIIEYVRGCYAREAVPA